MPKTRDDLIRKALGLLNVVQPGETATSDDIDTVDAVIDGKLAELSRRNVLYVQDGEAIEDEFFLPLAKIIANAAGPDFGQSFDGGVDLREEARLREMQREPGVNDTVRAVYY